MGVVWYVVILHAPTSDHGASARLRWAGGLSGKDLGPIRGPANH